MPPEVREGREHLGLPVADLDTEVRLADNQVQARSSGFQDRQHAP